MPKNNRITQSVILGLTGLMAASCWAGLKSFLYSTSSWLWPSISFLVLLVFLSLAWVLIKSKSILLTTLGIILVCFFFAFNFRWEYLVVLFIAFLFFLFGSWRAINEKEVRIKIQVNKIFRRGLPAVLLGFSLIIASACYFSPLAQKNQEYIEIPRPLFDLISQPLFDNFNEQLADFDALKQFGINLELNQEIGDTFYQAFNQEINKHSQPYQKYFSIGLSIGIFFALNTIGIFFKWIVIFLAWLIFEILKAFGAIKMHEKTVLQEVIEI